MEQFLGFFISNKGHVVETKVYYSPVLDETILVKYWNEEVVFWTNKMGSTWHPMFVETFKNSTYELIGVL